VPTVSPTMASACIVTGDALISGGHYRSAATSTRLQPVSLADVTTTYYRPNATSSHPELDLPYRAIWQAVISPSKELNCQVHALAVVGGADDHDMCIPSMIMCV
jgi:hypothetical protein